MAVVQTYRQQVKVASGLDVVAGAWLFISAFFMTATDAGFWNNIIFGIVVTAFALARSTGAYRQSWLSWINALIGLWILISPWALDFSIFEVPTWNSVITGLVILVLAVWSAMATEAERQRGTPPRRDTTPPPPPTTRM